MFDLLLVRAFRTPRCRVGCLGFGLRGLNLDVLGLSLRCLYSRSAIALLTSFVCTLRHTPPIILQEVKRVNQAPSRWLDGKKMALETPNSETREVFGNPQPPQN